MLNGGNFQFLQKDGSGTVQCTVPNMAEGDNLKDMTLEIKGGNK